MDLRSFSPKGSEGQFCDQTGGGHTLLIGRNAWSQRPIRTCTHLTSANYCILGLVHLDTKEHIDDERRSRGDGHDLSSNGREFPFRGTRAATCSKCPSAPAVACQHMIGRRPSRWWTIRLRCWQENNDEDKPWRF